MKPDGVNMDTTEPTEAAVLAELSSQQNVTEEVPSQPDVATATAPKANDEPLAADQKVKPKASGSKTHSTSSAGASGSSSRGGTALHRTVNDVKSSVAATGSKKTATTTSKASAAGAVPKRPVAVAAVSVAAKNQTKVLDKRPVGPARTTSLPDSAVTNGAKPKTQNGSSKRPAAEARPKTTATANKTATSVTSKPNTSTTRPGTASSKTTRPAASSSTSRMTTNKSKPAAAAATTKLSNTAASKTAASRVATTSSTGKTLVLSPKSSAAAKKDVSRPPSATVPKKLTTAPVSLSTKRPEPSKPMATGKVSSAPKGPTTTKTADAKASQSKPQQPAKPAVRFPTTTKPPLARTHPASPSNKPVSSSSPITKRGTKPTLTVPPFTPTKPVKNAKIPAETQSAASAETAAEAVGFTEKPEAAVAPQQESSLAASAVEDVSTHASVQHATAEVEQQTVTQNVEAAPSLSQSPVRTSVPQTPPSMEQLEKSPMSVTMQEQVSSPATLPAPLVASPADLLQENFDLLTDKTLSKPTDLVSAGANAVTQAAPPANLNEEDDEEEREGSQQVSVSEMSGTTQPTEESRPGSGGPVGGSAWRAGGALLSELDSEEVSGSQQGASELSAPGVLEGTESTDDLGDGSLKGAIDMEGASAGSPDFEKVPDIPVNDYEDDDDEDDSDRVCDMDVGSERTDGPQGPRHDNDVDEEEDDDVEMASEGVTESGLESYGNADEDDFAEDERLDNLNRFAQPPPPPPVLPSAPAAQWDQPNPFTDPWAEPLQSHQVLDSAQVAGTAVASPLGDPSQVDCDTPTQTPPQAWQEQGSAHFAPEKQDIPHHSSAMSRNTEAQLDQSIKAAVEIQTPPAFSAPQTSRSEDQSDRSPEVKLQSCAAQATAHSPQLDLDCCDLDMDLKEGDKEIEVEAEPETLPADEAFEGPSSSSVTEDEASDTEGETQLDSLESPVAANITFDSSSLPKRCLSTVEEREEAEMEELEAGAGKEVTPPSAASLTSYGSDSITTASNSNAQSTGESCTKSPGIFSLEELPEEAKEACFTQPPHIQPSDTDKPYIECRKQEADAAEHVKEGLSSTEEALGPSSARSDVEALEEIPNDIQPLYYSICEKTEDSFAGFTALPHPHRHDHLAYPRIYCDIVKPHGPAIASAKLSCADLPPRSPGQQARSPQLRRLEQHQKQLLELQQRREQQSRPLEEAEQERKRRAEEEERRKKEEAEEELKRNKEEEERKKNEERKVKDQARLKQKEEEELKQKQQILQWQQELQQSNKGQTALLSPSSGLCTIYEALENSDEEAEREGVEHILTIKKEPKLKPKQAYDGCERLRSDQDERRDFSLSERLPPDATDSSSNRPQDEDDPPCPPESPAPSPPLDLDWEKKVDIVQQLINQTLLLNGDGCSSLLLLPGGAGGTLSPLESSLWPNLLPPLTPPSATVTSVSSFSPEATGSSPQGEWTVVELETHH